jgi:chitosanase
MITPGQKQKILQIVNVFETGTIEGRYDSVTRYYDGPGGKRQITYGRSQTTEYGNLRRLIEKYIQMNGNFAHAFVPYADRIGTKSLVEDQTFIGLLKNAGKSDPVMKQCQDDFFDLYYYLPAFTWFDGFGFKEALSLAVIYDSFIHSGKIRDDIRQKFPEKPPLKGGNERIWIQQYVDARYNWLYNNPRTILKKTVYRMNCFKEQIRNNNWDLSQPVNANGTIVP